MAGAWSVRFDFDGKKYLVLLKDGPTKLPDGRIVRENEWRHESPPVSIGSLRLPDGRLVEIVEWSKNFPPKPTRVVLVTEGVCGSGYKEAASVNLGLMLSLMVSGDESYLYPQASDVVRDPPEIEFEFEGTSYSVGMDAVEWSMPIELPDGRIVKVDGWLESYPPKPYSMTFWDGNTQPPEHTIKAVAK